MNTGAEALPQASFGEGIGNIWMDSVQCTGSERSLTNCTAIFSGITACTHAHDAGVRCPPGMQLLHLRCGGFRSRIQVDKHIVTLLKAALKVLLGWWMEVVNFPQSKVVWRSVRMTPGAQYVIMDGIQTKL